MSAKSLVTSQQRIDEEYNQRSKSINFMPVKSSLDGISFISANVKQRSPINQFYANKSVFITGATGFLGKALLEKLLWQYEDIKQVYILIRAKKGQTVEQRFKEQIATSPIFDRLRTKLANNNSSNNYAQDQLEKLLTNKVKCIVGDVSVTRLGINDADWQTLVTDTSLTVIFHLAATVKFNEPLRRAIQLNVGGVKSIINLARQLKNLDCLCHVSTAYVNADIIDGEQLIEERLYPVDQDPQKMLTLIDCIDDASAKLLEPSYLKGKPNTYTYTKSLAEKLLMTEGQDLPVVIVRPSIVMPSWREPIRGWVDNFYGVTGVAFAQATGMLRIMRLDKTKQADLIPVDSCICTMISAVWHKASHQATSNGGGILRSSIGANQTAIDHKQQRRFPATNIIDSDEMNRDNDNESKREESTFLSEGKSNSKHSAMVDGYSAKKDEGYHYTGNNQSIQASPEELRNHHKVYHCTSGQINKLLWRDAADNMYKTCISTLQSGKLLRYPRTIYCSNSKYVSIIRFFSHTLVALLLDLISSFWGQKKIFSRNYKRLDESVNVLAHFTCNQWQFKTNNMEDLYKSLNEVDKQQLYSMDLSKMHWQSSWYDFSLSSRRFLLKRDLKGLPSDRWTVTKAKAVDMTLKGISLLVAAITLSSTLWGYPLSELSLSSPSEFICILACVLVSLIVWL